MQIHELAAGATKIFIINIGSILFIKHATMFSLSHDYVKYNFSSNFFFFASFLFKYISRDAYTGNSEHACIFLLLGAITGTYLYLITPVLLRFLIHALNCVSQVSRSFFHCVIGCFVRLLTLVELHWPYRCLSLAFSAFLLRLLQQP
jgi:hypothetical protein